jgi:hypothetical protein
MRKISEQAADALIFGYSFNKSNTRVNLVVGGTRMYLHGNLIAEKINSKIRITNDGWFTNVTKERLNAIPNVSIQQVSGNWLLNGNPWDGSWIEI